MDPVQLLYNIRNERARREAEGQRKPPLRFRASEVSDCARKIWYRLSGYAAAPRYGIDDDMGIDGDTQHDVVRWLLHQHGIKLSGLNFGEDGSITEQENKVATVVHAGTGTSFDVSSRSDGGIEVDDHGAVLLEIKSVGYWPYKYMQDAYLKGYVSDEKDENGRPRYSGGPGVDGLRARIYSKHSKYIDQMHVSMHLYGYDAGYLLIKDRSGCRVGVHNTDTGECVGGIVVPFDAQWWENIKRKLAMIRIRVAEGKPPLPAYVAGSDQCTWCPFHYLCHGAERRKRRGQEPYVLYPDPKVRITHLSPVVEGEQA